MAVSKTPNNAKRSDNHKHKAISRVLLCLLLVLIVFSGFLVKKITYNKVYSGVHIEKTDVSGLTRDELITKIPEMFNGRMSKTITLKIDSSEYSFDTLLLSPAIDTEKMADEAFLYGREKKFLSRLREIDKLKKTGASVPFSLTLNESELQKIIETATAQLDVTAVPNKIDYEENALLITRGKAGNGVLFSEVRDAVENCILKDSNVATVDFKYIEPEEISYEYIMRFVSDKPINAEYSIENHRIRYKESMPGVSLSRNEMEKAIKESDGSIIRVSAKITQPELSSEQLNETLLAHELSKYSTDYSSSSKDRAYNIKLACEKINGYILAPGEEFSYNDVVGPRTSERGFRMASVYVGNTSQPGIGGGICQVSSTLYNAAVFANLEITARKNHTLPVSYVPKGRDATVSYGAIDFKFKNSTDMPIEIRAIAQGGINTIKIIGTDNFPDKEIKIETIQTGSSAPKVVIEENPELLEGEIEISEKGTNGSSHISYKIVYENGKEISRTQLAKSTYQGKDRIEIHGTKKSEELPQISQPEEDITQEIPENEAISTEEIPAE